jgi:hypothetical protein
MIVVVDWRAVQLLLINPFTVPGILTEWERACDACVWGVGDDDEEEE